MSVVLHEQQGKMRT